MKSRFIVPKLFAVLVGMILVVAAFLSAISAVLFSYVPEPFRMAVGLFEEFTRTMKDEERILADEILEIPNVTSADPSESDDQITRIRITVTAPDASSDDLSLISSRCTSHGALLDVFEIRQVICTVVNQSGTELAKFKHLPK